MKISGYIFTCVLCAALAAAVCCSGQSKANSAKGSNNGQNTVPVGVVGMDVFRTNQSAKIGRHINVIFQDKKGNYWFGTNGEGVFRYNGKTFSQFTQKDGLPNNQVLNIQEDPEGNIWFCTGGFAVSKFDDRVFTTLTNNRNTLLPLNADDAWKTSPGDLWFEAGDGAYRYANHAFTYLRFPKMNAAADYAPGSSNKLGAYSVYCVLKDKKGNIWFGTQTMGVARFDGRTFKWLIAKGLAGPAVRGLFEDSKGNLWFGNNGYGLFLYDGKLLRNITQEKGLGNPEFFKKGTLSARQMPGTMARVWTINEDNKGIIWIGTIDAGVWRYDGKTLTNYTTKNGLTSNAINTIFKDKKGELWFGTDGEGVCKVNGVSFTAFTFN